MATDSNPFARGIFVPLGSAEPQPGMSVLTLGGERYDISPFAYAQMRLGAIVNQFHRNPINPGPLLQLQHMANQMMPQLRQHATAMHPAVQAAVHPLVQGLGSFLKSSQQLIGIRLKTAHAIGKAPKILVPICLNVASGVTTGQIQVRNPYLGASGGYLGGYTAPWAITSFRTSNNESGQLSPIRMPNFIIGGHDYAVAGIQGLTYVVAANQPAVLGWPAAAFAETKRSRWYTEVQPWTVVAAAGAGVGYGSIMTETGFFAITVFNGGAQTFQDTWSVYCNATLCGNPFRDARWAQEEVIRSSFVPLQHQASYAMKLMSDAQYHIGEIIPDDNSKIVDKTYGWLNKPDLAEAIDKLIGNPELAMGETFAPIPEQFPGT